MTANFAKSELTKLVNRRNAQQARLTKSQHDSKQKERFKSLLDIFEEEIPVKYLANVKASVKALSGNSGKYPNKHKEFRNTLCDYMGFSIK